MVNHKWTLFETVLARFQEMFVRLREVGFHSRLFHVLKRNGFQQRVSQRSGWRLRGLIGMLWHALCRCLWQGIDAHRSRFYNTGR